MPVTVLSVSHSNVRDHSSLQKVSLVSLISQRLLHRPRPPAAGSPVTMLVLLTGQLLRAVSPTQHLLCLVRLARTLLA